MNLLIIGDSFCHGIGLVSVFNNPANTEEAFGSYIAREMNMQYHNLAEPGTGIDRAIAVGYRFLTHNPNTFVIAGWSHPHRIGLYGPKSCLQILPAYTVLGNTTDTDVWTRTDHGMKSVADRHNQQHLHLLPQLHRIVTDNDLFAGQAAEAGAKVDMFRTWMRSRGIDFLDFNVFNGYYHLTQPSSDITFESIMGTAQRHPTADEHRQFANRWIERHV